MTAAVAGAVGQAIHSDHAAVYTLCFGDYLGEAFRPTLHRLLLNHATFYSLPLASEARRRLFLLMSSHSFWKKVSVEFSVVC